MMKQVRIFAVLAAGLLAGLGWTALHPQKAAASDAPSGTFLITITDATTGAFASRSVITLHSDHSMAVIDSGQEGGPVPFSSQLGVWEHSSGGGLDARTIDFSFPFATEGSARVDYKFNAGVPANQVQGSITLTFFTANGNPLDGGGTPGGTFNFTGTKVTVP
ncbi:MAG TPA: hypothetical protein VHA33_24555 [Candidatus Angelobacter sp.]|jgi:hypothetical protein|nr:hypothetical protein [Candidatus Angelobacter sp.]